MGIFEMVVLIVFIATVGKVAQSAFSRPPGADPALSRERMRALEAELRANDARVAQTEERVAELSEKLDFMEKLLAGPGRKPQLPESTNDSPS
jgi:hypothetical protein